MSRRILVLLVVSLTVNVFLIGAVVGGVYRWRQSAGIGLAQGWRARVVDTLPDRDADRFRATMRETVRAAKPLVRLSQRDRREAAELFVAPDYDAAAVERKMRQARTIDYILRSRVEDAVVRFAASLPQGQRQAMAKALRRGPLRSPPPPPAR